MTNDMNNTFQELASACQEIERLKADNISLEAELARVFDTLGISNPPNSKPIPTHEHVARLKSENARLQNELESHAWEVSPAMAQAKLDELNWEVDRLKKIQDQIVRDYKTLQETSTDLICEHAKCRADHARLASDYRNLRETYSELFNEHEKVKSGNARLVAELMGLTEACDDCLPMSGERPIDVTYYASKLSQILGAAEQAKQVLRAACGEKGEK